MIPRLKPLLGLPEIAASLFPSAASREVFEASFAEAMGVQFGISYAYGRTALTSMIQALGIHNSEIIMPAYTCVVVAHAAVLTGNRPVFVDMEPKRYQMDLAAFAEAFSQDTHMVLLTHLYGFPLDLDQAIATVRNAEQHYGHKIWIVQDCAHSFRAKYNGKSVTTFPDAALFGLNLAKYMTTLTGGIIVTNNKELVTAMRQEREQHTTAPSFAKNWERKVYALAALIGFSRPVYGLTHWLEHHTAILDSETKYYDEEKISFPDNWRRPLSRPEAAVGIIQLRRLEKFEQRRREIARFYCEQLTNVRHLAFPSFEPEASYSHFPATLAPDIDRETYIASAAKKGIQLGRVIEYCVPDMAAYTNLFGSGNCPLASAAADNTINLPMSPALTERQIRNVASWIQKFDAA